MEQDVQIYRPEACPEKDYIRQIWRIRDTNSVARTEKILPKGTAEIIINLSEGALSYRSEAVKVRSLPICFINGVNLAPFTLSVTDKQYFIGLQINSFALNYILGIPATEFNDRVVPGNEVCESLQELANKLAEVDSFSNQVEAVLAWFRSKISDRPQKDTGKRIVALGSDQELLHLSVNQLSSKYNLTPRHLRRVCNDHFGMSIEALQLYRKYLSALHQLHGPEQSLTHISYDCGFYDQAHLTRTFKLFTGLTPRQYKSSKGDLPGHLFNFASENQPGIVL